MANLAENIPLVNKDCKKKADFLCHLISQYFKTYSFVDINFQLVAYRYRNSSGPQIKRGTSVVQKQSCFAVIARFEATTPTLVSNRNTFVRYIQKCFKKWSLHQYLNRDTRMDCVIATDVQYSLTSRKGNYHFLGNMHKLLLSSYFRKMSILLQLQFYGNCFTKHSKNSLFKV